MVRVGWYLPKSMEGDYELRTDQRLAGLQR
jgi:hypothetical protein